MVKSKSFCDLEDSLVPDSTDMFYPLQILFL